MAQYIAKESEKFVNNTILYVDDVADGEYIYHDAALTEKVTRAEMLQILNRGPVVLYCDDDATFVCPQTWADNGSASYVSAQIVSIVAGTPATVSFITFYTKEYTAA